jgi:uncharacterized protein (TIGR02246 family)
MKFASETAERSIREIHEAATVALGRGDLNALMDSYADDVISLPPDQPALFGKDAVRSMWENLLTDFAVEVLVSIDEVAVAGPWAYERGTFEMKLSPRGGGAPIEDRGKYLDILHWQADGSWKYSRVSWSSSLPGPGS